jgi:phosphatidylserine/phosphatidylglycerophosphate/cardiolipin synthase-like enzyme
LQTAVVIDPYGANPVVMTGSHNMGPRASSVNDENLIIITGNGELASQYAGNIMEIYAQYRWRQSVQKQDGKPKWQGLADDDAWQIKSPRTPMTNVGCANSTFGSVPIGRLIIFTSDRAPCASAVNLSVS